MQKYIQVIEVKSVLNQLSNTGNQLAYKAWFYYHKTYLLGMLYNPKSNLRPSLENIQFLLHQYILNLVQLIPKSKQRGSCLQLSIEIQSRK